MKIHPKFLDPTDITTLVNKGTGNHVIADGFSTIPIYKGKLYSIKDVVNSDGTVNVRKAKKIMEEVAEYFGGKKMLNRPENPVWHKDDPNTWLHTKKVAKNAWAIPVPEGYTKLDLMVAALGHDFGKILSGDGHAEVSYNLIKLIFPDATPKLLEAVRRHMDDLGTHTDLLELATKFADIGVIPKADLTLLGLTPEELEIVKLTKWFKEGGNLIPKAAGGKKLLEDIFHKIFPGKTLKDLTPEEWDIAYDYILKKYNNNPSNILLKIRDYHFYTAAPDTIVKEASGKPLQVFHGGTSPNIREFSLDTPNNASLTDILDKRIYFSDKKGIASQYAVDPEYKLALTIDHLADAVGLDKEGLEIIASRLNMPIKDIKKIVEDYKIGLDFVMRKTNEEDFIYPAYLNVRKHADVDLDGDIIARLSKELRAKINAEPGAIIRNVNESVSNQYGIRVAPSTDYLVLYPQQIKRSAAITYDTNGDIIPISKRDNFHNPDINFKNGGNIEYFSKNSIIKAESGIKAILNAAKSASRKTTKKTSLESSLLSFIDDLFPEEVALRNIEKEKQIKLLKEFRNFKSKLDWSDDGWLSMRKHMDKYDPSLGPGESYGKPFDEITNPKGYTQLDKKIFRAYKNQLKEIEFITKKEGTWLDGGKFKDDPRLWVMMLLEKRKHGENVLELFSGMTLDQASNFAKYTGEVWGTEGIDKYFGDHYWPYRTNIDGFDTHDAYNLVYNTLSVPGIPGLISTDGLLKRANKGIIVKDVNENWSAVGDTSFNAPEHIVDDYAQHAGTPRWFLYGNTGNFNMGFNKYGGTLNKFQEGGVLEEPIEIPMFRHLPNEYIAQDFDNDLTELFYSRQIKYGQLSEKAERKLLKKYNLDYILLKETLDDLFNAGLGEALIADLIKANTNLKTFKQGGTIQKCSIGSAIRKFAGEGLSRIEKKPVRGAEENLVLQTTGTTKVIGKATTEHLRKVAKATNDLRIKVLADFVELCRNKGIKLPEEFNQFVDSIFKTPVATKTDKKIVRVGKEVTADPEIITHKGVSIERPTFDKIKYKTKTIHTGEFKDKLEFKRTIPKTLLELQELSPKIDKAINSLRSMMEGDSFKLTPTMMDEIYSKSKGKVLNFKDNKEQTRALRKLFGEIEYPTLVKRLLDSSYIYPQAPSLELARFYDANTENIEWFRKIRNLVQQYVNDPNYLDLEGKVQVTPLKITPRKLQVAVYHKAGDYVSFLPKQIMTKQDAPYIKAYRLTINGKPIKGTPTFNFEEHHSTPLSLMQAEAYLTNPSPKNAMEHVLTYLNLRKVNGSKDAHYDKFLVLDKTEHTGINGIHYNDKWSLQDLQRIKALARSGRFKTMDDLLYYYDRLKALQLSYLPKAKQGTKLIPKNAFGSTLMRELVPKASKITGKTERQLIKELALGTLSEKKLIELTKDVVESVNGKILKPELIKPGMLDFEHYWYFGHGTDVEHLPSIMLTGLKGSLSDTAINLFLIGNLEVFDAALEMAKQGKGLHHNAKGFNVILVPKLPGQTKPPKDLLDYLTPEEVTSHIVEDRTPARFNYFAVDTTI